MVVFGYGTMGRRREWRGDMLVQRIDFIGEIKLLVWLR
jgi:hypothetical protein